MSMSDRFDGRYGPLRCVFFSLISRDKGADLVLQAAELLPEVEFHLYGRVAPGFGGVLRHAEESLSNVEYHGVFDSVIGDVYDELRRYDVHLLPTSWPNEGVPGVLVETKVAAVPSIVSNCQYNAEIVNDGMDGFVLEECTTEALVRAICRIDEDRELLDEMKANAFESAERYYIDRYIDWIVREIEGEDGWKAER